MYEISSYADIVSILRRFLNKKQIVVAYFSKIYDVYIPILVKKLRSKALKFNLSKSKLADHVAALYQPSNKSRLTFVTLQKIFTFIE